MGHASLSKFCEGLGVRTMQLQPFHTHMNAIFEVSKDVAHRFLQQAREVVVEYDRLNRPEAFSEDGILNLAVSYDGSWPKRGYTSKVGCGAAIDLMTGLVIDFHVMSLHCQLYTTTGERLKARNERIYKEWLLQHRAVGQGTQNYTGTSGGMEVAGALEIWGRSTSFGMRYTTLLGDGDTKTYLALCRAKPYGDIGITKEECVNHVSKRLNTGLGKLKSTLTKKNIRIGENAEGSLTDAKIGLLQSYFTKAVRTHNESVEVMAKAIGAGYYHSISTDEKPQHQDCPAGQDSWCWYQHDLASGIKEPTLGNRQQSTFLNSRVGEHVKEVYERLTNPELLSRCLLGKTQNTNESLHSMIWSRCPKHLWSGYKRVFIAAVLGVGEFNMGSTATRQFLTAVGCSVSSVTRILGTKRDTKRVKKADDAQLEVEKRRRESRRLATQKYQEAMEEAEGGSVYVAGGF